MNKPIYTEINIIKPGKTIKKEIETFEDDPFEKAKLENKRIECRIGIFQGINGGHKPPSL